MTSEVKLSNQKRRITKVDDTSKRIRKKIRCCRETSMTMIRSPAVTLPLQKLYMCCLDAFRGVGTVPLPSDDQKLRHILDCLMPEDILPRNIQIFDPNTTVIEYTSIYQCKNFWLYAFFMPQNCVVPLHSHPGMTVFSKLLFGKVHMKAYDLVNPDNADNSAFPSQPKLACLETDDDFTAPYNPFVLYPTSGGNIHTFTAITPSVILDVVGPPYSKKDGRDCSYYKDISYTLSPRKQSLTHELPHEQIIMPEEDGKCYRWLEEIEMPKEANMERVEYFGPKIDEVY